MTGIPLVNSNSVDDINTSIIAIKKEMKSSGETEVNVNVNLPDTAIPVDEVTSGNMHSVTSNAVATGLSSKCTTQNINNSQTNGVLRNRVNEGIVTINAFDTTGSGLSIDLNYTSGAITLYKFVNGVTQGQKRVVLS